MQLKFILKTPNIMITPLRNIIAGSALAFATVASASVLDEWTFTSGTPQVSDIQGRTMGNWDPALAGTSVPSAGLLRDATGGNSTGAFYGDNLGVAVQTLTLPKEIIGSISGALLEVICEARLMPRVED
jgi:hypothetical protein